MHLKAHPYVPCFGSLLWVAGARTAPSRTHRLDVLQDPSSHGTEVQSSPKRGILTRHAHKSEFGLALKLQDAESTPDTGPVSRNPTRSGAQARAPVSQPAALHRKFGSRIPNDGPPQKTFLLTTALGSRHMKTVCQKSNS